jgi:hypothetical protein
MLFLFLPVSHFLTPLKHYNNSPYYKELILFYSDIVEEYKNSNLKYSKYDLLKNGKILQKYYIKHKYKLDIMTTIDEEIFVCEKINFDNAYKEFDKYIVSKMDLFLSRDYSSNMNIINDIKSVKLYIYKK